MKRKTILLLFCTLVQFLSAQTALRCGTCAAPMPTAALTTHSRAQRAPSQTDLPTLDLLIVYDKTGGDYAAANGGEAAHAQRIVDLSNVVLNNSHIAANFRLAGTLRLPDVVQSVQQGLTFVLSHEGVAAERRRVHADIVVLCSEPINDGLSGVAPSKPKSRPLWLRCALRPLPAVTPWYTRSATSSAASTRAKPWMPAHTPMPSGQVARPTTR